MGEGETRGGYHLLTQTDVFAPVPFDSLPQTLVHAVACADWPTVRAELELVMDGLSTDGRFGRALLQLVRQLPIGLDPVFDRFRAAVAIDHGDWDDLRRCLGGAPFQAAELVMFREALLKSVDRFSGSPTTSPAEAPFLAYEFELTARSGWYRQWARRLPTFDARSRISRPDVPAGRHFRYRALHQAVLLAVGEAHAGSLHTASALAREGKRLGDDGEPLRDMADDLGQLILVAMGEGSGDVNLRIGERTASPNGMSPLGTLEWLMHVMPFLSLLPAGWLVAGAQQMQRISNRLGSPKAQLQADAWVVAAQVSSSESPMRTDLLAVLAHSRRADAGLRVLPELLNAIASRRYTSFEEANRLARSVGNVWAQVTSLAWMAALDPSPRVARNLLRLVDVTGWRRPILVPAPVLADAVLGMVATGARGQAILEMALASGRTTTAVEVAERHATDKSATEQLRLAGVEALARVGTTHARRALSEISRDSDIGKFARVAIAKPIRNAGLTDREVQVLDLAGQGLTNREIAARLSLSHHTIARHLSNSRDKLGAVNRADAAVRLGRITGQSER